MAGDFLWPLEVGQIVCACFVKDGTTSSQLLGNLEKSVVGLKVFKTMLCLLKSGWVRRSGYYPLTGARVCLKVKQNNNQTQVLPGACPVTSAQPNNYTLQDTITLYKKLELSLTLLDENPSKWNIFWFYEALDLHPQAPWLWNQLHPTSIPFHLQQSLNDELMFIFCMMAVIMSALPLPHSFSVTLSFYTSLWTSVAHCGTYFIY